MTELFHQGVEFIKQMIDFAWALNVQIRSLFGEESLWREFFGFAKVLAIAYMLVLPFELVWSRDRSQKFFRQGFGTDIGHAFLTPIIGKFVLGVLGTAFVFALMEQYLPLDPLREAVRSQPLWLQALQAFIVGDFLRYWFHRWTHEIPFAWRIHACHHSPRQLDILATLRVHPLDIGLRKVMTGAVTFACGFSIEAFAIAFFFIGFWGYFNHANIKFPDGSFMDRALKPLGWIVASPRFHHWHHSLHVYNVNYGTFLTIWDDLFGSAYRPKDNSWPAAYGIQEAHPTTWVGQMVHPLLPAAWQGKLIDMEAAAFGRSGEAVPVTDPDVLTATVTAPLPRTAFLPASSTHAVAASSASSPSAPTSAAANRVAVEPELTAPAPARPDAAPSTGASALGSPFGGSRPGERYRPPASGGPVGFRRPGGD